MRLKRLSLVASAGFLLAPPAFLFYGWVNYKLLEKSVVEKMDEYYLDITTPGREQYLLEGDEVFDVPYMASQLSVSAVPTRIYDAHDRLIGEFAVEKGVYVRDPGELPNYLKKAIVATEDATFYDHHGVNYKAITRATLVNLRSLRKKQGGSTLTQQLAKLMFTTRKKTMGRKVFEIMCARKLESKFTKDQILLMYFNFVYFGHGCFGIESAARYYFDKPARELQLAEAALLAGIIASPNHYSPFENLDLAKARHHTVLARMAKNGFIPAASVDRYWSEFWKAMEERLKLPEASFWRMQVNESPYLVERVRRYLDKEYSKERILKGGLKVHTTFDLEFQKDAQRALQQGLREENLAEAKARAARPAPEGAPKPGPIQGGLAAVDPHTGAILAMVGGGGFNFSNQLDRSVDIQRPIGSSVKPFVWAAAFESGKFSPEDKMLDAPLAFSVPGRKKWAPHNYGNKYFGEVTLRAALQRSLNSVAIKLLKSVTLNPVIDALSKAAGAPREDFPHDLSLALGTADLSPLQVASAYAVFVNSGVAVTPRYIDYIEDRAGNIVHDERPSSSTAVSPIIVFSSGTCQTMIDVMQGVLQKGGSGYSSALKTGFNIPAAGKTGTTSDYRDAWFSGVTPDLAASVWIGHDDMRTALESGRTGGSAAAPIWMEFVKATYRNRPTREFDKSGSNR